MAGLIFRQKVFEKIQVLFRLLVESKEENSIPEISTVAAIVLATIVVVVVASVVVGASVVVVVVVASVVVVVVASVVVVGASVVVVVVVAVVCSIVVGDGSVAKTGRGKCKNCILRGAYVSIALGFDFP